MGADFTKFQGMLGFALEFLPADNRKRLKTQPTSESRRQRCKEQAEWNYSVFIRLCRFEFQEAPSSERKLAAYNSTVSTTYVPEALCKSINI
jgi:hypothetical protein